MKLVPTSPTYWLSPVGNCDLCHQPFNGKMYDAKVGGPWGNICQKCFQSNNCRLGLGLGQAYEQQTDSRWLCVGGER